MWANGRSRSAISVFPGYYTAMIVQEDGQTKIMEDCYHCRALTITAPTKAIQEVRG
jgi:hypothetical protein